MLNDTSQLKKIKKEKLKKGGKKEKNKGKKYKDIQDKLEKISEETNARAPECMALKEDVIAKKRAYNEAEVRENFQPGILKTAFQI